jgi:hypothetical protein
MFSIYLKEKANVGDIIRWRYGYVKILSISNVKLYYEIGGGEFYKASVKKEVVNE